VKATVQLLLIALAVCFLFSSLFAEARLFRYPDIHQDRIVFVYAGDLWLVSSAGGTARKLTSHQGRELFPKFSPDGSWIAFSAEYSGNRQVYVIPANGGEPKRLTFYADIGELPPRGGFDYQILDWTPDSKKILVRCNRLPYDERGGKYFLVDPEGGYEQELPIPEGAPGTYSPDGKKIAYNPISREFRTWKRYRGGRAQEIWLYDFAANKSERITNNNATDNFPMWVGNKIYFTSDRDNKLNLYEYDLSSKATRKVTHHDEYDVLWPSRGVGGIVYENGGHLYVFNPATGQSRQVSIELFDDKPDTRPYFKPVDKWIESFWLSPSGKRALFEARGDIFTVPAEHGDVRNLTQTQGVRERTPVWSPDGKNIVYQSDASGEYEFYLADPMAKTPAKQLTRGSKSWAFGPVWSPNSKYLAFADKDLRLRILEVASGNITEADQAKYSDINNIVWAPDSRWLAYTKDSENRMAAIWLYSMEQKKAMQLTDDYADNFEPAFDPEGRYLYFISKRDFNLRFSEFEFAYLYDRSLRIYVGTLRKEAASPFAPKSDEESGTEEKPSDEKKDKTEKSKEPAPINIDVDGFVNRVVAFNIPAGDYRNLQAVKDGPIYLRTAEGKTTLYRYNLEKRKEETILAEINGYDTSADGKKVIYKKGETYGIVDLAPEQKAEGKLAVDKMVMHIDPKLEWKQMFADVWRIERDWFYDPNLHGVDWPAMKERYGQLVPYVAHRADLDYIFGELVGELAAGHTYVQPGDQPKVSRVEVGLLGAEVEVGDRGYYRIKKIFAGENWHDAWRSPLTEPGIDVKVGDYIIAINGHEVRAPENFFQALENTVGTTVTLKLGDLPVPAKTREVQVKPIANEYNLRYLDWVKKNRDYVEKATNGRVGYIHLPNTANEGNRELFKWFYPQALKDGLIIDVRYNGGGFIPDRMIELLNRSVLSYWARRGEIISQTPGFAHQGPKVCLINELSSSGGDAFPYYFKKLGLGPLIGKRTWGGLIGISGNPDLVDGGSVTVPAFSFFNTAGEWDVENVGVAPDIEVENPADLVISGHDPQLERGVEEMMKMLKAKPQKKVEIPAYPKR